jgi:hypothetical protein
MKVFLVKVGKNTRGGNFQELHSRAVSVSEKYTYSDVERYFGGMYEGFEVKIERVKEVDLSPELEKLSPRPADEDGRHPISRLRNFCVQLTDGEKKILGTYNDKKSEMENAANALRHSIERRYKELPYTFNYPFQMEIEIEYRNVICQDLVIHGDIFTEAVKKGEGIPCVEIPDVIIEDVAPKTADLPLAEATPTEPTEFTPEWERENTGNEPDDIPF